MFKKILQEIIGLREDIKILKEQYRSVESKLNSDKNYTDFLISKLEKEEKFINQLMTNSFENNNNNQIEVAVFVPYRGTPYVYKDGKKVSTDHMTSFDIDWAYDRKTEVTVRSE